MNREIRRYYFSYPFHADKQSETRKYFQEHYKIIVDKQLISSTLVQKFQYHIINSLLITLSL